MACACSYRIRHMTVITDTTRRLGVDASFTFHGLWNLLEGDETIVFENDLFQIEYLDDAQRHQWV